MLLSTAKARCRSPRHRTTSASATATPGRTPAAWERVRRRLVTPALEGAVMERIILPAIAAMEREGRPFKGILYAGLMLTEAGPMLLEFNVCFGDPEGQVLMMRLMSDPLPALIAAHDGVLKSVDLRWHADSAVCVVMAANGYPASRSAAARSAASMPQRATRRSRSFMPAPRRDDQRLLADGGRVLGVTALGDDLAAARDRAYAAIDRIDWPDGFCRRDIGAAQWGRPAERKDGNHPCPVCSTGSSQMLIPGCNATGSARTRNVFNRDRAPLGPFARPRIHRAPGFP